MATTLEAILGAVHLDGGDIALAQVMDHLGLTHPLLETVTYQFSSFDLVTNNTMKFTWFTSRLLHSRSQSPRRNGPKVLPYSCGLLPHTSANAGRSIGGWLANSLLSISDTPPTPRIVDCTEKYSAIIG
jgi:hypothetical protein